MKWSDLSGSSFGRAIGVDPASSGDQDYSTVTITTSGTNYLKELQQMQQWHNQRFGQAVGNTGYSGYSGYTGWSGPALRNADPEPKTFPEESAAVAGFAAGIKHALNLVMGTNGHSPEKQKLYEEVMSEAVKMVLAPEASGELKKRALFRSRGGSFRIVEMGELAPESITTGNRTFRRKSKPDDCPIVTYEEE